MLPGETIARGAPRRCWTCVKQMEDEELRSAAGYYIGTVRNCGPYSRESVTTGPMRLRKRHSNPEATSGTNPNPKLSTGKPD